jgi:hypothetical protein
LHDFELVHRLVILSEALRRSIAYKGLYGAKSKDPGNASLQMLLGAFRPQTTWEDKKFINSDRSGLSRLAVEGTWSDLRFLPVLTQTSKRLTGLFRHTSTRSKSRVPVVTQLGPVVIRLLICVGNKADTFDLLVAVLGRCV